MTSLNGRPDSNLLSTQAITVRIYSLIGIKLQENIIAPYIVVIFFVAHIYYDIIDHPFYAPVGYVKVRLTIGSLR